MGNSRGTKHNKHPKSKPADPSVWKPIASLPPGAVVVGQAKQGGSRQRFIAMLQESPNVWFPYKLNHPEPINYQSELPGTRWAWVSKGHDVDGDELFDCFATWVGRNNKDQPVDLDGNVIQTDEQ